MKKSLKTIVATLVAAIAAIAPAQSHAVEFGFRAGLDVTVPGELETAGGVKYDIFQAGTGFHAGVVADIYLPYNLFFEPGLNLVYHTNDIEFDKITKNDLELRQVGLVLPLRFGYNIDLNTCDLQFFTGPSFGVGVYGKIADADEFSDPYDEKGINISRFNVGWNLGAGVKIDSFYIGAEYSFGLNNRYSGSGTWRQSAFSLSLGYYL